MDNGYVLMRFAEHIWTSQRTIMLEDSNFVAYNFRSVLIVAINKIKVKYYKLFTMNK